MSSKVAPSLTKANSSACLGSWSAFHLSIYQSPAPFLSLYPLFTEFWFTSRHSDLPSVFSSRFTFCPFQTCKSCTLSAGSTVCLSQFGSVFCTRRIIWPWSLLPPSDPFLSCWFCFLNLSSQPQARKSCCSCLLWSLSEIKLIFYSCPFSLHNQHGTCLLLKRCHSFIQLVCSDDLEAFLLWKTALKFNAFAIL